MRGLPVAVLCALAACAPRLGRGEPSRTRSVTVEGATVRMEYLPEDEDSARQVAEALAVAVPRAQRWGALRVPVTITLHPSHEALETAVHRAGFRWLRAWARFDSVDLQSPRTWSRRTRWPWIWFVRGPSQRQIQELLTHELTHCAMYQAAANEWSWAYQGVPLWFREGMASVTAEQGYRRAGPEAIRRFYAVSSHSAGEGIGGDGTGGDGGSGRARPHARGDPLSDPDPLYQSQADVVYDTAHLAFQFLLARYGEDRVRGLLHAMSEGHLFRAAFEAVMGIPVEAFEADFRRYIVWRGWKAR
jgi:hypothetical protein